MTVIVDTNIIFSACYTPSGRIFDILFNIPSFAKLISCRFAIEELTLHRQKLEARSNYTKEEMDILIESVLKQIDFFNEAIIDPTHWLEADRLTKDVDHKDITFVALALQTNGILWTGDKKLATHLRKMNFSKVMNTTELSALLEM